MILALTHPDYRGSGPGIRAYEELLKRLADLESCWRALPSEVSAWWRRRAKLELRLCDGSPTSSDLIARRGNAASSRRTDVGEEVLVARVLIIAYTTYAHDGRVKRQAEALSCGAIRLK